MASCSPSTFGGRALRADKGAQVRCGRGQRVGRISARRALEVEVSVVANRAKNAEVGRPVEVSPAGQQPVVVGQVDLKDKIRRLPDRRTEVGFFNRAVEKVEKQARLRGAAG